MKDPTSLRRDEDSEDSTRPAQPERDELAQGWARFLLPKPSERVEGAQGPASPGRTDEASGSRAPLGA